MTDGKTVRRTGELTRIEPTDWKKYWNVTTIEIMYCKPQDIGNVESEDLLRNQRRNMIRDSNATNFDVQVLVTRGIHRKSTQKTYGIGKIKL